MSQIKLEPKANFSHPLLSSAEYNKVISYRSLFSTFLQWIFHKIFRSPGRWRSRTHTRSVSNVYRAQMTSLCWVAMHNHLHTVKTVWWLKHSDMAYLLFQSVKYFYTNGSFCLHSSFVMTNQKLFAARDGVMDDFTRLPARYRTAFANMSHPWHCRDIRLFHEWRKMNAEVPSALLQFALIRWFIRMKWKELIS